MLRPVGNPKPPNLVQEQRGIGGANAQMSDESQKLYERFGLWHAQPFRLLQLLHVVAVYLRQLVLFVTIVITVDVI